MKIIDISWPISAATTGYKDKRVVVFESVKNFARDGARETNVTLSCHTGTHVDAPAHFLKDGVTNDQIPLDRLIGMATVVDCSDVQEEITYDILAELMPAVDPHEIILLKTANSATQPTDPFLPHFVYLQQTGARYLVEKKARAVGIDYLGIERAQPDHATHTILMSHDVLIVEGLRLAHVKPGRYEFYCLPLALTGTEAAPARAILIER